MTLDHHLDAPALDRHWGAHPLGDGQWSFALWAPKARRVAVVVEGRRTPLEQGRDGLFRGEAPATAGETYRFTVDGDEVTDPAARALTGDIHSPGVLVDPSTYDWQSAWSGRPWDDAVLYELHIGTFTSEGTFAAAARRLPDLAELGITAIEIMPVGQFPGKRGWGYDPIFPFAPHSAYGTPDDFRALVDTAQGLGLMVILDVVYNHFGPEGLVLSKIAPETFDPRRASPWGQAIDYTQPAIRRFFIENALSWLTEYRLDGLRLDAIEYITDPSSPELVVELARRVRGHGFARPIHLTTEDNRNITRLHDPWSGLYDAEWNDDYHHALHSLLTGETTERYSEFQDDPLGDLCLALASGYVRQGQDRPNARSPIGEPSGWMPWGSFINFNQNHDQVGNRAFGERLIRLVDPRAAQVAHALLLTAPFTPLLFMGEESGERSPFYFFADYAGELGRVTQEGRAEQFAEIPGFAELMPDPLDRATFVASRPFRRDDPDAVAWRNLTSGLLRFRHAQVVPLLRSGRLAPGKAQPTGPKSLMASWPCTDGTLRIAANIGTPPDSEPPAFSRPPKLALGNVTTDDFAFSVWIDRKRSPRMPV